MAVSLEDDVLTINAAEEQLGVRRYRQLVAHVRGQLRIVPVGSQLLVSRREVIQLRDRLQNSAAESLTPASAA